MGKPRVLDLDIEDIQRKIGALVLENMYLVKQIERLQAQLAQAQQEPKINVRPPAEGGQ